MTNNVPRLLGSLLHSLAARIAAARRPRPPPLPVIPPRKRTEIVFLDVYRARRGKRLG